MSSSLLAGYSRGKPKPARRNAARSFLKESAATRMLTPVAHPAGAKRAYHSILAQTQPVSFNKAQGLSGFLNRSYDQQPPASSFQFEDERQACAQPTSIYMTDDELLKMDNLISSIKEETRSLKVEAGQQQHHQHRQHRSKIAIQQEVSFPHTDTAEFARLEGTASFELPAARDDAERQIEEKAQAPPVLDLSPVPPQQPQQSESSDDQTYFPQKPHSPFLPPEQGFVHEDESFSQKNLKPEFDALLNTFQSDQGEIKRSLQQAESRQDQAVETDAKQFKNAETQSAGPGGEGAHGHGLGLRQLNAFQTYDLLKVESLVNRLSSDNEVIHEEAEAYRQAFEFMVEKHRDLQKFLLMEKQKTAVLTELKNKYVEELREKEAMVENYEHLKEKQLRLVETVIAHEQAEAKAHEEDEALVKGLTAQNQKLREMLHLALESLRDLDEESKLLEEQERNMEEKQYVEILQKLRAKKAEKEQQRKLKSIQVVTVHGEFEIPRAPPQEVIVQGQVVLPPDGFDNSPPPPPNRQNSLNDPDPINLLRLRADDAREDAQLVFHPRGRMPPRIEEEEQKVQVEDLGSQGEENKIRGRGQFKRALVSADNERPYRYSDNDSDELKEGGEDEVVVVEGGASEEERKSNEEFQWDMLSGMLSGEFGSPREQREDNEEEVKQEIIEPLESNSGPTSSSNHATQNVAKGPTEEEEEDPDFEREDIQYLEGSFEFDEMNMEDFLEQEQNEGGRRADVSIGATQPQEEQESPPFKSWAAEEGKLSPFKEDDGLIDD